MPTPQASDSMSGRYMPSRAIRTRSESGAVKLACLVICLALIPGSPPQTVHVERSRDTLPWPRSLDFARDERCRRSEEHKSELQSLMRISYAVFCSKNKK